MSSVIRTRDDWTPWYERTKAELTRLAGAEIHVGILGSADGELLRIAAVHEFGATIHPRNAKNLAIPLRPDMKGKSPRDVEGAFFWTTARIASSAGRRARRATSWTSCSCCCRL